jgi:hypothetical protein
VNLLQGFKDRISKANFALDAKLTSLLGFGGIKDVARKSICEGCYCTATIYFGLGAFGLELVQDASEDGDLPLIQVEFVGQESQWSAHAETTASTITPLKTFLSAMPGRTP